jgi:hypothetical protein
MTNLLADKICDNIPTTTDYYRLLMVVAPSGAGKTRALHTVSSRMNFPYVNLNLELGKRLLRTGRKQRPLDLATDLRDFIRSIGTSTVLVDNIEILFDKSLEIDPLSLLQQASRNTGLVVAWNGKVEGVELTYAERGHPEYLHYPISGLALVTQ